jgi:hypothetical protein
LIAKEKNNMTYEEFVKRYYYKVNKLMSSAKHYSGMFAELNYGPLFMIKCEEYSHFNKEKEKNNYFYYDYEINKDAPLEVFENWFNYANTQYMSLQTLIPDKVRLNSMYEGILLLGEDIVARFIDDYIDEAFRLLLSEGILIK